MIEILIADDHVLFREGLKRILKRESDLAVIAEATNGREVIDRVKQKQPDIVLLDISMPGESGLEVLEALKRDFAKVKVLILSMHPEDRFASRAFKMGALGYITKESAVEELVQAIRKIVSGGRYVSPAFAEKLASDLSMARDKLPHERLSNREFQIMRLIAAGKKIHTIAEELSLSRNSINTYRMRILEKMEVQSNAELTRYAIENKLIE
ncbi:MAG: response regulator transcription factor [Chloroflexi bacterium]|nr:response regulator transcription factor [Chloroflexota bacterium]